MKDRIGQTVASVLVKAWIAAVSVAALANAIEPTDRTARGAYVLEVKPFVEWSGAEVLLLTYSLSGAMQCAAFPTRAELDDYIAYLANLGSLTFADKSGAGL